MRDAAFYGVVSRIRKTCDVQLRHQPTTRTRNRFRAEPNAYGEYELRDQPYRIYFDMDEAHARVVVLAVLYKPRETSYRRGEKVSTHE